MYVQATLILFVVYSTRLFIQQANHQSSWQMVANGESQSPFAWQGIAMLVLSRKKDEKIIIGDNITLMVIEIRGDKVRLGIDAPKEVAVHREEVYDAIQKESDNPVDAP